MKFLSVNVLESIERRDILENLVYTDWQSSRTHRGKSATYLIAEYHPGRLQSFPLGKLCTHASA